MIKIGTTSEAVKWLQKALKSRNLYLGYEIDGVYGSHTADAIGQFQARVGIYADGSATNETFRRLGLTETGEPIVSNL